MSSSSIPFPFGDCRICGDKATGTHYGVNSCEGCKGFFKRSIGRHEKYKCKYDGTCTISLRKRIACKTCRFQRCLDQGMSLQSIRMGRIPKEIREMALLQTGSDFKAQSDRSSASSMKVRKKKWPSCSSIDNENTLEPVETMEDSLENRRYCDSLNKNQKSSSCITTTCSDGNSSSVIQEKDVSLIPHKEPYKSTVLYQIFMKHVSITLRNLPKCVGIYTFEWLSHLKPRRQFHPDFLISISNQLIKLQNGAIDIRPNWVHLPPTLLHLIGESESWFSNQLVEMRNSLSNDKCSLSEFIFSHSSMDELRALILTRLFLAHRLICLSEYRDYQRLLTQIETGTEMVDCLPKYDTLNKTTHKMFVKRLLDVIVIFSRKTAGFMLQIPGFHLIPHEVKLQLSKEGAHGFWILTAFRLLYNGEYHLYTTDGTGKYSVCWMETFLSRSLINQFMKMSIVLRECEFTDMQVIALIAYHLTNPHFCPSYKDSELILHRLHQFYYDLLLWSLEEEEFVADSVSLFPESTQNTCKRSAKQKALLERVLPLLCEVTNDQRVEVGEMNVQPLVVCV